MTKVFISQPMKGKTDEQIKDERDRAFEIIRKAYPNSELIDSLIQEDLDEKHPGLKCLSKSIEMLDDAAGAWFLEGWQDARGCRIEHACCIAYGIPVYYLY